MCLKHKGPLGDIFESQIIESKKPLRRKNDYLLRDTITALAICHNVTPVEENGQIIL